jgi:hypothetical protein
MLNFCCNFVFYFLAIAPSFCEGSDIVGFDEVKKGIETESVILIDVCSREEVKSLGKIPGAFNFPGEYKIENSPL